jgi:hypothetical protein
MSEGARESSGGVVGVASGLALFLGLAGYLFVSPVRAVDGEALLEEWFEFDELPYELEVAEGVRTDVLTVVLANPNAPSEAARADLPEAKDEDEDKNYDWLGIPMGAAGTDPVEAVVTHYPDAGKAIQTLERLFGRPRGDRNEEPDVLSVGSHGGRATLDRGRMPWGDYSVLFVHERELERGGTFRDLVRVNLTFPGRAFVVSARWPRGFPGSKEKMEALIATLRPRIDVVP